MPHPCTSAPTTRPIALLAAIGFSLCSVAPAARAQAPWESLRVAPLSPVLNATAGDIVVLRWHIDHRGSYAQTWLPTLTAPDDWEPVLPLEPLTLAPGEETIVSVSLAVPASTPAGEYPITLSLAGAGSAAAEGTATVRIAHRGELDATFLDAPASVTSTAYRAAFAVRQRG
ncbi:MAG TPA: NEW3 domain-containing protein, partial [Limnochordia bacterium]